jgi:hypothetical protein
MKWDIQYISIAADTRMGFCGGPSGESNGLNEVHAALDIRC